MSWWPLLGLSIRPLANVGLVALVVACCGTLSRSPNVQFVVGEQMNRVTTASSWRAGRQWIFSGYWQRHIQD